MIHGPRDLPGWYEARESGQVSDVPAEPPELLDGVSAASRLLRLAVVGGTVTILLLLTWWLGSVGTGPTRGTFVLAGTVALLSVPSLLRAARRWGEAVLVEAAHGYATTPVRRARWWVRGGLRVPAWDFSGLWVLETDGTVVSQPDRDADPPGWVPGPEGRWALWTGVEWVDLPRGLEPSA